MLVDRFRAQGWLGASVPATPANRVVPSDGLALHGQDSTNGITVGQGICSVLLHDLLLIILFRVPKIIALASAP